MLKNCLIFATGAVAGGYVMYNKIYRTIANSFLAAHMPKKNNKSETEKKDN